MQYAVLITLLLGSLVAGQGKASASVPINLKLTSSLATYPELPPQYLLTTNPVTVSNDLCCSSNFSAHRLANVCLEASTTLSKLAMLLSWIVCCTLSNPLHTNAWRECILSLLNSSGFDTF